MSARYRSPHHRGDAATSRPMRRLLLLLLSGLSLTAAPTSSARAQTVAPAAAEANAPFAAFVAEASHRFGIPVRWIHALMRVESANDLRAISPKGAMGLMQIMPGTWTYLRVRYRLGNDPFDPRDNIIAGTAYMRELYDRYGAPGFLAAYNAGPGRYEEYRDKGRPLPAETRAYVAQLTPLIGGKSSPNIANVAEADPPTWTRAPLFVSGSERTARAAAAQPEARSADSDATIRERDLPTDANATGGLFVSRQEAAGPR